MDTPQVIIRDAPALKRYEAVMDEHVVGVAEYVVIGSLIVFTHTEVSPRHQEQGIAGLLAKAAFEGARDAGLQVVPRCPFMSSWLERHPQYQDLLAPGI